MATLPIFSISPGREAEVDVDHIARDVLGGQDLSTTTRGPNSQVRGPNVTVDVDRGRGLDTGVHADVAVGCALGYLDFRFPELHWRGRHANLAHLLDDKLMQRPSFADTIPS